MKQLFILLAMLLNFSAFSQLSDAENKALDKLIADKVEIEADVLKSSVLKKMFDTEFYTIKRTPHYKANGGYFELILMKNDGKMTEVEDAAALVPLFKSDFKMKEESNARDLKMALALLLSSGSGSEDEIIHKENQWILVCEEWFGEKKGFIVSTEPDGKVSKIEYSSKLEI